MTQVVTFEGYTPIARYDSLPWTTVRVEEAGAVSGPWTQIDEIALSPLDADPSDPQARNVTTALASSTPLLWYRLIFVDAALDTEAPTDPVQNGEPTGRNLLCTLDDVTSYVPAYISDPTTDSKLRSLIGAQSQLILSETGREIVPLETVQPALRTFPIDQRGGWRREVIVGDLASLDDIVLRLLAWDRTLASTLDTAELIALYGGLEQPTEEWEPITSLSFPWPLGGPVLLAGQALEVTAHWGFPQVPAFVREACAGRVILRYLNDVANAGTAFSDAIENVNLGALFQSSEDAVAELRQVVYA